MRRIIAILFAIAFTAPPALAGPPAPGDTVARYDVRLLGVKLGEMTLAGRIGGGAYAVSSQFSTRGIVSALADTGFDLKARGRVTASGFTPQAYDERIDTGSRRSTAQLRYTRGVPRITGGTLASAPPEPGETPLDPSGEGGTLDPLTAMFAALHDRPRADLCKTDVTIFDGARRSAIRTTARADMGAEVLCTGAYFRLAGFTASELKRQTVYPFTLLFAPGGDGRMQARRLTVRTRYGNAELLRR
ncbi:DUF3108 domain-containing protein [Roseovarius spongiae]|uniref:DUF3108 domain-containing protein n=1 Tax=Roseovarius spongiae TaxID=2320272 RepID=A0A3A8AX92_9RHOB|nr:DUF3108 domain-containing protein [Roseovarius spongiae]RKF16437.1 DUF3108 domain-containing protein [Roseovarius spongiae]